MKRIKYTFICLLLGALASCTKMDIAPKNIVTDDNLLSNQAGMSIYMSRLYSQMPWEDFKYLATWGFNYSSWLGSLGIEGTGEAVNRESKYCKSFTSEDYPLWDKAMTLLHDANHLIESLEGYKGNYPEPTYNDFLGQGYFVRAYVFTQMARRYGGVPLVTKELSYPVTEETDIPRSSEKDTWDQVLADYDMAISLLQPQATFDGTASKYAALAFKAEAMLYAGSVAKYNQQVPGHLTGFGKKTNVRVIGFDENEWQDCSAKYFAEAYKAAREVISSGAFSLYKKVWKAGDAQAQYQNMVDMWRDLTSPENILVRKYEYPIVSHGLDAYSSPYRYRNPLSAGTCPTLDFMELFDGFDRYDDGHIRVTDGADHTKGNYLLYDSPLDLFKHAEPRLRAYVIFPGDEFKGENMEVRMGIYTGPAPISTLKDDYSYSAAKVGYQSLAAYTAKPKTLYLSPKSGSQQETVDVNGTTMTAAGIDGPFYDDGEATVTGLYLRKYLDPNRKLADIGEGKSDQPFILMRYADVLLAAAESAVELSIAGKSSPVDGDDMLATATSAINEIRERAGAELLEGKLSGDNDSRNIVRKERRKELAFEQKSKWDIRRWRVIDEQNRDGFWGEERNSASFSSGTKFRFMGLYPFYSSTENKWFFDEAFQIVSSRELNYTPVDYYFEIPSGEVSKSKVIDQQPNR